MRGKGRRLAFCSARRHRLKRSLSSVSVSSLQPVRYYSDADEPSRSAVSHGKSDHPSHGGSGHTHHLPTSFGRAFAIGITLNIVYVFAQVLFGLAAHSLALLADAGHNLGDVMGLIMAWGASVLARRQPTARYTYGLRRSTILASLANAILLLVAVGGITWEAIRRFGTHEQINGITVICVAAVGVAINGITAMLFASGQKNDLNIKGAFMHMAADAAVSAGVVVAGLAILVSGWSWLDPLVSLVINAIIVWGTWAFVTRLAGYDYGCCPARNRCSKGAKLFSQLTRGYRFSSFAYLGPKHDRNRADRPLGQTPIGRR